ncbi:oligosaccharide flippase family protein [Flavobacterium sp. NST-5]|uniref:Oligosaccharide flippase family protein n=1 Tax=Flavobacterium ichthyis TaxID=2698827 RepID=A0ABW9Z8Y2_9FLAO|nr:O-antigen translocase [Flavobacterium ichthyis]NBL65335.1 oligosaccharide flippase family protein [Flavobacterium ichthyis]
MYKKVLHSTFVKVASLNSFSVVIKILSGLITSKIVATFLGASGMALLSNLRNFYSSVETVASLGFQNGIVKYAAENKSDVSQLKKTVATLFISMLCAAIIVGIFLFFAAEFLRQEVFGFGAFGFVFQLMAFALPFYILGLLFTNILNGFAQFKAVIFINIAGNILGLLLTVFLVIWYGINGAFIATVLLPAFIFLVSLIFVSKEIRLAEMVSPAHFDFKIIKQLAGFSLMTFVSGFIGPMIYLMIRNNIINTIGTTEAGFWAAVERISFNYMLFVSTLLTVYFMPKLVEAKTTVQTGAIFRNYFKSVLPVFALLLIGIYIFREFITKILFSADFLPIGELLPWQLAGDFFKAASLILGYQFFAKKMTITFIISEILSLSILYCSSLYFIEAQGSQGVVIAYFITYLIYFLGLSIFFRKELLR